MRLWERKLGCLFLGHALTVWQEFHFGSRRVVCDRCLKSWGLHDETKSFIPWSADLESMYREIFGYTIRRWP